MGGHYLARERQAHAGATFLGREKGYKNLAGDVVGNAGAVVTDFNDNVATAVEASP